MIKQIRLKSSILLIIFIAVAISSIEARENKETQESTLFKAAQESQTAKKWEEALDKFSQVVALNPDSSLAHRSRIEIGKYHKYHRDWQKAIEQYREVILRAPHTREAHDAMTAEAAIHYFRQDFKTALPMFEEVLAETKDWDQIKYCSYWIKEIQRKMVFDETQQFSCGRESIKIALEILGIQLSEDELKGIFKDKTTMLSLLDLNNAASKKGLKPKVVKVSPADIANLDTPFIALVEPEHYVVVTKTVDSNVTFIDPANRKEPKTQNLGEFSGDFKGYALVFLKDTNIAKAGLTVPDEELSKIKGGVCSCCPPGYLGIHPNIEYDGKAACKVGMPSWLVNTVSLNFIVQDIDLSYTSRGMPVTFIRTYNSDDPRESIFGRSWTFNYSISLTENPDKSIDVRRGDGRIDHFFWNGTRYQGPKAIYDTLVKNADGTYSLTIKTDKPVYNFNALGKLVNIKDRNANTITFTYDAGGKPTVITDPNGKKTTLTYGSNNKVSRITLPDARYASFVYDANNNLIQTTDLVGATSSFTYDSASYLTGITTPHQGNTAIAYILATISGARSVAAITDAQGNKRSYGIYPNSYQVRIVDSRGNAAFYVNNSDGYTLGITTATGNKIAFEYDVSGNRTKIKDTLGNATGITYDGSGNPLTITDPLSNKVTLSYDTNNNLISATDPKANVYSFTYDANSNLTSAKDADNRVTGFEYNSYGQLTRLTDAKGARTDFAYDTNGDLTKMTDPLGKITTYAYDTLGRLTQLTDPKAQVFKYTYDGVDHLVKVTNPDLTESIFSYTCCNLITAQDASGTLSFTYDSIGRLRNFTNQDNKTIGYEYDSEENLIKLTYPDAKAVTYAYDADNRLIKVTDWLGNVTEYKYDSVGNLSTGVSPGIVTIYKYDNAGRLTKLMNYDSNTAALSSGFEFTMDANSNRTNIKRYLPLVGPVFPTASASYSYNSDNQLMTATGKSFSYDENGNTVSISGSPSANFTYNFNDQLTQYQSGTTTLNDEYDALGNRIKKTGVTTTKYIVNPAMGLPSILCETDSTGIITSYYVYGLGLISKVEGNNAYFYQYDGIGSTVAITDSSGAVKNKYAYDDFGNVATNSTETISNPFKYVGQYGVMTDTPDLLFMRARYYMPSVGRFINKDPIGLAGGINLYGYVGNNAINWIDPHGLFRWDTFCEGAGEMVAGAIEIGVVVTAIGASPYISLPMALIYTEALLSGTVVFGVGFNNVVGSFDDLDPIRPPDIFWPPTAAMEPDNNGSSQKYPIAPYWWDRT